MSSPDVPATLSNTSVVSVSSRAMTILQLMGRRSSFSSKAGTKQKVAPTWSLTSSLTSPSSTFISTKFLMPVTHASPLSRSTDCTLATSTGNAGWTRFLSNCLTITQVVFTLLKLLTVLSRISTTSPALRRLSARSALESLPRVGGVSKTTLMSP